MVAQQRTARISATTAAAFCCRIHLNRELEERLLFLPPDTVLCDDEGRALVRVADNGTLVLDRSEDN